MKRTRFLALIFNLYSMSAVASYECVMKLAHIEDLYTTVAERTLTVKKGTMDAGSMGTLYVESEKKNKKISLDINAVLSGWAGEEDATIVMIRRERKKRSTRAETISEKMTIKGDNSMTAWFDSYKLEIQCQVKDTPTSENVGE